ncbi:bacterial Ig-like domain-containing protein [Lactobacillus mulieris]|uniref:LPXTG cell wall anchor domain-containing protein n=1 Tax=Lactobacillus mulieris TaxID=2508708 RepID=A0AAP3M542_9LACO|nr:bacterial Ig-like domain-containing protein [Lactobacillus mulieris]MCZ3845453.1 LPXTG cell wall anchor domain-containing protein [Lactobacillus mulieris]MCZ3877060.1 LPXTG cell wall anchor domain-containing protein [Lactobacillus mulieris]MCZ3900549.1 LPXTG cell wall anchor domain-containing protein [Lactobacillus mulieris]MCZ9650036.1 LPXTG cell wall anchor domain-containing protein [Lactobacillus mulieris]
MLKAEVVTYDPATMALTSKHVLTEAEYAVEDNVNTNEAGVYSVKYSYKINDNDIVTKTAKVTVLDKKTKAEDSSSSSSSSSESASSSSSSSSESVNSSSESSSSSYITDKTSSQSVSQKSKSAKRLPETGTTTALAIVTGTIAIICSILLTKKNKK